MGMGMRPLVAGNWKMNGLASSLTELEALKAALGAQAPDAEVLVCPPFTLVAQAAAIAGDVFAVGGQDCDARPAGAHTGDIAAEMLKDAGASYVIVGHSERRQNHGERNADVALKAEAAWRAVLKAHPESAEAYAHLGQLEARQEHYKEAAPFYRKALALNPAIPGLRLNLGLALFKNDQLKEAVEEFTLLKEKTSTPAEAQRLNILLGMAHYGLGDYAVASRFLKDAAVVDTQNLQLRLALAHSCLWSKQYQCVLDTYHEMLTLNAESAEADMLAGEAEDEIGRAHV